MDVLVDEVKLPSHLDRLTDTALDLRRVQGMVRVGPEELFVILSGSLFKLTTESAVLEPVDAFDSVTRLWPADENCALVESEGALWRVDLDGTKGRLLTIPRGTISCDVKWSVRGLIVGALVDRRAPVDPKVPYFYPTQREKVTLCRYASIEGWHDLADVPEGCGSLSMCRYGRRIAWRESLNVIPEEAQRGEFYGFDLNTNEVRKLTEGAGKAGHAVMASDGSALLYEANHEAEYPITTHTDLWWLSWDGSERVNLTEGGRCIARFGWGLAKKPRGCHLLRVWKRRRKCWLWTARQKGHLAIWTRYQI